MEDGVETNMTGKKIETADSEDTEDMSFIPELGKISWNRKYFRVLLK